MRLFDFHCDTPFALEKDREPLTDNRLHISLKKLEAYDSYGQLIRENNKTLDKTFVYEYNKDGGIDKVKEYAYTTSSTPTGTATEKAYTYDSSHPDRLTNYRRSEDVGL